MANEQTGRRSHFSQPVRQIFLMLVAVGLFSFGAYIAYPRVAPVFLSNPYLNGVILLVFVIGVLACFIQVIQLISSVIWIEGYARQVPGHENTRAPRMLAPLASLLRSRGADHEINSSSARSILDSVVTRIEEARDITRYITSLLIFLGLLGTFYGLATTVPAVVETIRSLAPSDGETGVEVFSRLMSGLEAQLGGMGTAFASSLLGLAGSLVVGLLELFASHGQNRFYRELEEWLSTITRLGFATGDGESGGAGTDAMVILAEQLSKQSSALDALLIQMREANEVTDARLAQMVGSIEDMVSRGGSDSKQEEALLRIADGQERLAQLLEKQDSENPHVDPESRMRLRSIDVQLLRVLEEISAGRQETMSDLRGDIATLTRTLQNLGKGD
ncbi:biopolymer transporter ExbB [Actibacterium pelagium]|uniref:Biopolymer transporter ExbB n=1 Tax=Actibacterium pelagium TaxID=2029103 RepID=A0A917ALQ6_9RHOB|nr:biopolymer transporter ExbB [Actibacterium pelagium]GGE59387.1 hypothetical protein GCM10011517_28840 [Actibacterium pelagium]